MCPVEDTEKSASFRLPNPHSGKFAKFAKVSTVLLLPMEASKFAYIFPCQNQEISNSDICRGFVWGFLGHRETHQAEIGLVEKHEWTLWIPHV